MPPEAPTDRRLAALALRGSTEPIPKATGLHSFFILKCVFIHGSLVPGTQWAQREPHQPGPCGVYSPVGQADVKCMSTLCSHSDECREGDTGGHESQEQGDLRQAGQ